MSILHRLEAVCFDVDSTICKDEGIDVLASYLGVGEAVQNLTTDAMNGNVDFQSALAQRLLLINPSVEKIKNCLRRHPPQLSDGAEELVRLLMMRGIDVFLVSGGFRLMIEPVAEMLSIPKEKIFANTIYFDKSGAYAGYDKVEPTCRDGGKATAVQMVKVKYGYERVAMVGDGITDAQARPDADVFIGYGGVVLRENVQQLADYYVTSFHQLTQLFDGE